MSGAQILDLMSRRSGLDNGIAQVNNMSRPDADRFALVPRPVDLYADGPQTQTEDLLQHKIMFTIKRLLREGEVLEMGEALAQVPETHFWLATKVAPVLRTRPDERSTSEFYAGGFAAAALMECDEHFQYFVLSAYVRDTDESALPLGIVRYGGPGDAAPVLIDANDPTGMSALDAVERQLARYPDLDLFIAPDGRHVEDARAYLAWAAP